MIVLVELYIIEWIVLREKKLWLGLLEEFENMDLIVDCREKGWKICFLLRLDDVVLEVRNSVIIM